MAFITEKSIFIHVQKCAGMSVRQALYLCRPMGRESGEAQSDRHSGLPELLARSPGIDSGRIAFGFVRDPVTWIQSRWMFANMTGFRVQSMHRDTAASHWLASCWSPNFETFVGQYLERYPGIASQTMFRMLGLWSARPVDMVGRVESLEHDLLQILDNAGEVFDRDVFANLPRKNEDDKALLDQCAVSPALAERIRQAEKPLCDRFYF